MGTFIEEMGMSLAECRAAAIRKALDNYIDPQRSSASQLGSILGKASARMMIAQKEQQHQVFFSIHNNLLGREKPLVVLNRNMKNLRQHLLLHPETRALVETLDSLKIEKWDDRAIWEFGSAYAVD